jgi:adenylate kinase
MDKSKQVKEWLKTGSINIFGMPFSGKDTQAERLGKLLDAPVIAGGKILRDYPDRGLINQLMSTGDLLPPETYLRIVIPSLSKPDFTGKPLVLASVGRLQGEEAIVIEAAKTAGHPIKAAIYLKVDEDEIWRRFEVSQTEGDRGKRYDDNHQAIELRLVKFKNKTLPVIETYRKLGLLKEVDGSAAPEAVTEQIINALLS